MKKERIFISTTLTDIWLFFIFSILFFAKKLIQVDDISEISYPNEIVVQVKTPQIRLVVQARNVW